MEKYRPRVRRDFDIGPRGNSRNALALLSPANQRSAVGGWASTHVRGAASTQGTAVFVRGVVEVVDVSLVLRGLWPGDGTLSFQAQRDLDVGPWATLPALWLYAPWPISDPSVGVGVSTPCEAVSNEGIADFVHGLFHFYMYLEDFLIRG